MSAPYVVEQQIGGHVWYVVSAGYQTAFRAKQVWETIDRKLKTGHVGMYRHGPEGEPGVYITAVSLNHDEIQKVANMLRLGEHNDLSEAERLMLIARRARVVTDARRRGQSSGRLRWRRPEDRGAVLDPLTGDMIEREPGEG